MQFSEPLLEQPHIGVEADSYEPLRSVSRVRYFFSTFLIMPPPLIGGGIKR